MVFLKDEKSYANDDRCLGNVVSRSVNNECFFLINEISMRASERWLV